MASVFGLSFWRRLIVIKGCGAGGRRATQAEEFIARHQNIELKLRTYCRPVCSVPMMMRRAFRQSTQLASMYLANDFKIATSADPFSQRLI